jgi:hypothetical protein
LRIADVQRIQEKKRGQLAVACGVKLPPVGLGTKNSY